MEEACRLHVQVLGEEFSNELLLISLGLGLDHHGEGRAVVLGREGVTR